MKALLAACAILFGASSISPSLAQFVDKEGAERVTIDAQDFGYVFRNAIWPSERNGDTIVFVCWEPGVLKTFPNEAKWVQTAVSDSWQKHSRIQFRGWKECSARNSGIRITVLQTGPRVKDFGKRLNDLPGGMELNFKFDTWS